MRQSSPHFIHRDFVLLSTRKGTGGGRGAEGRGEGRGEGEEGREGRGEGREGRGGVREGGRERERGNVMVVIILHTCKQIYYWLQHTMCVQIDSKTVVHCRVRPHTQHTELRTRCVFVG